MNKSDILLQMIKKKKDIKTTELSAMQRLINDRMIHIIEKSGMTKAAICDALGWKPQSLTKYINGQRNFTVELIQRLAQVLDFNPDRLYVSDTNTEPADFSLQYKIPVISWVQAGKWHEAIDMYQPGVAEEWVSYDTKDINSFCLRVRGNSMLPEYRDGDLVVVSPNTSANTGDDVIAKCGDQVTFKRLKAINGRVILTPLNPEHDTIIIEGRELKHFRIIGVVVALIRKR